LLDLNLLSTIKYMFTNGIKKIAKGVGATIFVGSALTTGVDSGFNLHDRYKRQVNNGGSGSNNN